MTTQKPGEPQKLDYEFVPSVQTFFEVHGGGPVVQRVVRFIAPAVHLIIRIIAYFVTRVERRTSRVRLTTGEADADSAQVDLSSFGRAAYP